MADHFDATIEAILQDIAIQEAKLLEDKQLVNRLATRAGRQPVFSVEHLQDANIVTSVVKKAEFFSKPLTSAIKTYLGRRNQTPASAEEIHAALLAGGYDQFPSKKDDAINGLRISIGKNAAVFARIPDGENFLYGLNEWYGITKRAKVTGSTNKDDAVSTINATKEPVADEEMKGGDDA